MTDERKSINIFLCGNTAHSCKADYIKLAIKALENQEKIKELVKNWQMIVSKILNLYYQQK